jgi:hypothetical protein
MLSVTFACAGLAPFTFLPFHFARSTARLLGATHLRPRTMRLAWLALLGGCTIAWPQPQRSVTPAARAALLSKTPGNSRRLGVVG